MRPSATAVNLSKGDFKIQRRERQKERQKNNNNFARAAHFFEHFIAISARLLYKMKMPRFMENVNKQR